MTKHVQYETTPSDRPAFEITDQMVEAGVRVFRSLVADDLPVGNDPNLIVGKILSEALRRHQ